MLLCVKDEGRSPRRKAPVATLLTLCVGGMIAGRFSFRGLFVGRTGSARARYAVAHEQPFLAFVRRVNQVKVIDTEFFEFFPQALFVLDGMDAALFLGEDIPGIETDAFG